MTTNPEESSYPDLDDDRTVPIERGRLAGREAAKQHAYPASVSLTTIRRMRRSYDYLCRRMYRIDAYGPCADETQALRDWCSSLSGYWPHMDWHSR